MPAEIGREGEGRGKRGVASSVSHVCPCVASVAWDDGRGQGRLTAGVVLDRSRTSSEDKQGAVSLMRSRTTQAGVCYRRPGQRTPSFLNSSLMCSRSPTASRTSTVRSGVRNDTGSAHAVPCSSSVGATGRRLTVARRCDGRVKVELQRVRHLRLHDESTATSSLRSRFQCTHSSVDAERVIRLAPAPRSRETVVSSALVRRSARASV